MVRRNDNLPPSPDLILRSQVAAHWRPALEQLLFFNTGQDRVRRELTDAIDRYGTMEVVDTDGQLTLRVQRLPQSQALFAVGGDGRPIGCVVYCRVEPRRILLLHLAVAEDHAAGGPSAQTMVLMHLIAAVRGIARRTRGVETVELLYGAGRTIPIRAR